MTFESMITFARTCPRRSVFGARKAAGLVCAVIATSAVSPTMAFAGQTAGTLHCRSLAGASTVGARPGASFTARVTLESKVPIIYNSAIFRVVLTGENVSINDYAWASPFETGGATDFSLLGMELPSLVTPETLEGPAYPADVLDVEFANFLLAGDASNGTVVEVEFVMPAKAQPGETFFIAAVPDTFAFGFISYPVDTGSVLTVRTTFSPDFDGDGSVGAADLALYLAAWGTPNGDLDGDGLSNSQDLALLLASWD